MVDDDVDGVPLTLPPGLSDGEGASATAEQEGDTVAVTEKSDMEAVGVTVLDGEADGDGGAQAAAAPDAMTRTRP